MFNVRYATKDEVEAVADKFMLYHPDNEGNTFVVCELDGDIVGFAQLYGININFLESIHKGAGKAMVEFLKEEFDHLRAIWVVKECRGFWEKMGFVPINDQSPTFGIDMEWWAE